MVWIIRGFAFIILLGVMMYLFLTNSNQAVDLNLFGSQYLQISIYWVVGVCYLLGFATSFILAAVREFRLHRIVNGLKKEMSTKDREIADLRVLPLKPESGVAEDQQDG